MKNFIKTILSGVQVWTRGEIRKSTADWNQNDPNADNYVKNRTHWEEEKEQELSTAIDFSSCDMVSWDQTKEGYLYEYVPLALKRGQNYNVTFDEQLYLCEAFIDTGYSNIVIGNGAFVSDSNVDNNLPFAIGNYSDGDSIAYVIVADQKQHTFSITTTSTIVHKLDKKYIPEDLATIDDMVEVWDLANEALTATNNKMDKNNPTGTGSFSMNRKSGTTVGNYSHAEGKDTTASGYGSHAEGSKTIASNYQSHAEGNMTNASGHCSHAEGSNTTASGYQSHAEGYGTTASGNDSHAEGFWTTASGEYSHAEGNWVSASGKFSHAEGYNIIASGECSHVQGKNNISDTENKYAHIVGNGTSSPERSNAHTLDWEGNAWYSGDVYVGSTSGTNKDEGSKKLATEEYVDELVAASIENKEQVQPDWEQSDENAVDYIKNKPFYTRYGRVALVDNLTRENYENGIHPVCNFVPGQSYDVVCDDILYENIICIEDDGWNVILGDTFYIDDDGGNGLYIEGFEEDWSTLSIFTTQETVKKIDEKYLPNVRKVLKLYTCYSEDADDGRAGGTPALAPDKILRVGFADWEDYVTVEALANADDIVIFEGQTKVGVPANITFCTDFDDYYGTSTEYAIITFYSEHEGKIRTMWSRENIVEYLATQGYVKSYVDAEISKISAISLTENLTDSEKQEVRENIGAGTSNFSGSYNDLTDKPDLGQQELITPEDIDIICGQSIELASEVLL